MNRRVALAVRVAVFTVVGASSFPVPGTRTRDLVTESYAFAISLATVVLWMLAERPSSRAWQKKALPLATLAMAITTGWASLTAHGGQFSLLTSMATIWAGYSLGLAASCAITGTAAVSVIAVGLAYDVGTWGTLGYPIVMFFSLFLGRVMHESHLRAEAAAKLVQSTERLREEQLKSATLEERNRIAREIHDVLAHSLGALGVQIQAAQALLADQRDVDNRDIDRVVDLLGQARRTAAGGLEETRRALFALRAGVPPLTDALAELSAGHERHYGASVSFEVAGAPRTLSADAGLALTRTAQEALVNTAKHAPRQPVEVRLDFGDDSTVLTVANGRLGVPAGEAMLETANGGYGLAGLRERLLLLGGSLLAGPDDGGRWVVTAQVPQ